MGVGLAAARALWSVGPNLCYSAGTALAIGCAQYTGDILMRGGIMYQSTAPLLSKPAFARVLTVALRQQWHSDAEQPRTLLSNYIELAHERYSSRDYYVDTVSGGIEAYTSIVAAIDVVEDPQNDLSLIFLDFTTSTVVMPQELDIDAPSTTWGEWKLQICASILHKELIMRYPDLKTQDRFRMKKYTRE
jgi:hypothetical protein